MAPRNQSRTAPQRDWRSTARRWLHKAAATLVTLLLAAGLALWWAARWTPPREDYPYQGVTIGADNGTVPWGSVKAAGADFGYIMATAGKDGVDAGFARNLTAASEAGVQSGAIHRYSLCSLAADQAENFIRRVPRRAAALPSAVWLDFDADCPDRPTRALVLSELATFLAQIEAHMGKRSLIAPSAAFEAEYHVTHDIARTSWLRRNFFAPDYGAHPWAMWQANDYLRLSGIDGSVGWNVVQREEGEP